MKENRELMDQKITDIGMCVIGCLNGREFNKIILGFIIEKIDESIVKNMELFYENKNNEMCYFNELIYNDDFNDTIEEDKYLKLHKLLTELYEYCTNCGDEWKYVTLVIENNGNFSIDFKYEPIEVIEWRKQNGLLN